MSAQSPGSFGLSVLLHAGAAGLVLFFTYANFHNEDDAPKVLELVAGAGDNYAATAAPALGNSAAPVQAPPALPPEPLPAPAAPAAPPIQDAPPEAAPKPAAKAKPTPNPADLLKNMERAEARRKANLERKYQREKAAEAKKAAAEARQAALNAARLKHVDAEGIKEGVVGGSTANQTGGASGKALSREDSSLIDAYFAELKAEIKAAHVPPTDVTDNLSAKVQLFVAADGAISQVRIVGSSGNADFDRSVIDACEHTHSIGPRPDGRGETVVFTFKLHEDESQ